MCYSAQIEGAYRKYIRLNGAEMDLEQFEENFGHRVVDPSMRIARAVELWFENPKTEAEHRIRNFIDQYRMAMVTKLETEIFTQRRRLADAERKLESKPTKAACESQRIATAKIETAVHRLPLYKGWQPTALDDRIFPLQFAPIVLRADGRNVVRLARYHCRQAGKPVSIDRKYPGLYNARRDNLEKFWRKEFGQSHAVMLVSSFYENVEREGKNRVLHFVPRPVETMTVACLYSEWVDPTDGKQLLSFAAVTDEPPAEVAAAGHDRCIVNLKPESIERWLTPEGRSVDELQAMLEDRQRPYYEHEMLAA
jgi:putative SOS response-associated peptidase YedK